MDLKRLLAVNPLDKNIKVPVYFTKLCINGLWFRSCIWLSSYDQRDLDFAKKYNLKITPVVKPDNEEKFEIRNKAYVGDGKLINSDFLNGLKVPSNLLPKL